ncbi:hypothetical protein OAT67_01445 [Bacteriovoracaceae bacterium]|nr:hypothetical protein [Bacteriovoracaceae bacterium]
MSNLKKTHINDLSEALKEVLDKLSHSETQLSHLFTDENVSLVEEEVEDVKKYLEEGGRGIVNGDLFHFPIPKKIIESHFSSLGGVAAQEEFGEETNKLLSLKIIDPMNIGYYSDVISDMAHREGFDFFHVRRFVVSTIEYITYLKLSDVSDFPLDVYYGFNESSFFIRIVSQVENFVIENIIDSFDTQSGDPYKTLLNETYKSTDLCSINHIEKSEKLMLTGLWCKNQSYDRTNGFSSLLIGDFDSCRDKRKEGVSNISSKVLLLKEEHDLKIKNLPGDGAENYELSDFDKTSNIVKIKRIVEFIVKSAMVEEIVNFSDIILEKYLQLYPDQKSIEELTEEDKKLITSCITDDEKRDILEDNVTVVTGTIDEDDYLDSILGSLESLSTNEATYMIKGSLEEEEEETVISGVTDDVWKVKRSELVEEVNGKMNDLRGSADKATIEKEIKMIVNNRLNTTEEETNSFMMNLKEDATEDLLSKKDVSSSIDIRNRLEIEKLKGNLKLRDSQIGKMKKMLTSLKVDIEKIRKEKEENQKDLKRAQYESEKEISQPIEITNHKEEIDNLQRKLRAKKEEASSSSNEEIKSEISDIEKQLIEKEATLELLEEKERKNQEEIKNLQEELKKKELEAKKVANADNSEKLQADINALNKKLELKDKTSKESADNSKQAVIASKLASKELETSKKQLRDKELVLERERSRFQTEIDKLKIQNEKLVQLNAENNSKQAALAKAGNSDLAGGNDKLKSEIEQLKKKISVMYENSKVNDEVIETVSASDMLDDNKKVELENSKLKKEVSDKVSAIKALEIKLAAAERNNSNSINTIQRIKDSEAIVRAKEREVDSAKVMLKKFEEKLKEAQMELKKQEVKIKFLTAQSSSKSSAASSGSNGQAQGDAKSSQLVKKLENDNKKLQLLTKRTTDELTQKKGELNKMKVEKRTLENKLRDAERKMQSVNKKKAS